MNLESTSYLVDNEEWFPYMNVGHWQNGINVFEQFHPYIFGIESGTLSSDVTSDAAGTMVYCCYCPKDSWGQIYRWANSLNVNGVHDANSNEIEFTFQHLQSTNWAFVDGHAEWMGWQESMATGSLCDIGKRIRQVRQVGQVRRMFLLSAHQDSYY